jgi:hypothetical protein
MDDIPLYLYIVLLFLAIAVVGAIAIMRYGPGGKGGAE